MDGFGETTKKRAVIVIEFDDPENSQADVNDLALTAEIALSRALKGLDVTVYSGPQAALRDAREGHGPYAAAVQDAVASVPSPDGTVEEAPATPAVFVSVGPGGVYDVSSDDLGGRSDPLDIYVIDETKADEAGLEGEIEADDGSTYRANVKRMAVTGTHFDHETVRMAAGDRVWANGQVVEGDGPAPSAPRA